MKHVVTHKDNVYKSEMYRIVFLCVYVKIAIAILLFAFMLQPIAPAYANEAADDATSEEEVEDVAPEPEPEPEPEPKQESEPEPQQEELAEESGEAVAAETDPEIETVVTEGVSDAEDAELLGEEEGIAETEVSAELTDEEVGEADGSVMGNENQNDISENLSIEEVNTQSVATSSDVVVSDIESTASTSEHAGSSGGGGTNPASEIEEDSLEISAGEDTSATTTTSTSQIGVSTDDVSQDDSDDVSVQHEEEENDEVNNTDAETEIQDIETNDVDAENVASTSPHMSTAIASSSIEMNAQQYTIQNASTFNSDLNKYQFAETECISVGDGSFYCSKAKKANSVVSEDAIFVQPDEDGDQEIFVAVGGKYTQITHNLYDDTAPYFDEISNSIVWQRLTEGRYQIVSYNITSEKETVLTNNTVNDMEPSRSGEYTVWQRWIEDNWEVMLYDGKEEVQITHSTTHDIGAHVKGGYVIWNTNNTRGERLVMVYEIETGLTSEIKDIDGGMVENPRFVLVYDTTHDNGDVITKGYDFESGQVVPLAALPHGMPTEIPEPDSTGEVRALIQTKSANNEEEIVDLDTKIATGTIKTSDKNASTTPAVELGNVAATSSLLSTEIEEATTTIDMTLDETEVLPLSDFDLIVEPYFGASSTQQMISDTATSSVE